MLKVKDLTGTKNCVAVFESQFITENRELIAENIMNQIREQGGEPYIENNRVYVKGSGQFFRLPTMQGVRHGKLTFRSKDFVFEYTDSKTNITCTSYGDKPKSSCLLDNGFFMITHTGEKIVYTFTE